MVISSELLAFSILGVYLGYAQITDWDFDFPSMMKRTFNLGFINVLLLGIAVYIVANPNNPQSALISGIGFESLFKQKILVLSNDNRSPQDFTVPSLDSEDANIRNYKDNLKYMEEIEE